MSLVLLTNCTRRKRWASSHPPLQLPQTCTTLPELVTQWQAILQQATVRQPAQQLYAGRSVQEVLNIQQQCHAAVYFVSAGLGLIHAQTPCPDYDVSISPATALLATLLRQYDQHTTTWWSALHAHPYPICQLVQDRDIRRLWIALPMPYWRLISADLLQLTERTTVELRLFTSAAGRHQLPDQLQRYAMPYDARLEAIQGFAGTAVDFPQRAMQHFAQHIGSHAGDCTDQAQRVHDLLAHYTAPIRPTRQQYSDAQLIALLRTAWAQHHGQSTKLLRYLRDDAQVACEQGRFRRLWQQLALDLKSD